MSTEITEIKGRYEVRTKCEKTSYDDCCIHINRFYSGRIHNRMLQLTINGNTNGYIQLTKEQVKELIQALKDSFNDDIYPSE